jgi:hypothetical protein
VPASLAPALLGALMLAGGALLYVLPASHYRALGLAALGLGTAVATGRYLGLGAAAAVASVTLAIVGLALSREPVVDQLGLGQRLLLIGFAGASTLALAGSRPLGDPGAVDLNIAWYWTGALGCLLLVSERESQASALGGALLTAAVGLATLHLAPATPLLGLWALPPVALVAAGRWNRVE